MLINPTKLIDVNYKLDIIQVNNLIKLLIITKIHRKNILNLYKHFYNK